MDTSFSNRVGNHGTPIADKADNAIQAAKEAGSLMVDKFDSAVGQVKGAARGKLDSVKDAVRQTRESVSGSSEALITYTQDNPIKALLIAAASGALLWTLLRAFSGSRD